MLEGTNGCVSRRKQNVWIYVDELRGISRYKIDVLAISAIVDVEIHPADKAALAKAREHRLGGDTSAAAQDAQTIYPPRLLCLRHERPSCSAADETHKSASSHLINPEPNGAIVYS